MPKTSFELVLYYIYPALRRETALFLKSKGMRQVEIARLLGLTKAAVTQYVKGKRKGYELPLKYKLALIKELNANLDYLDNKLIEAIFNKIIVKISKERFICSLHYEINPELDENYCESCIFAKV